jgi:hypothetical protein
VLARSSITAADRPIRAVWVGVVVSRDEQLRAAERHEQRSARLRARFGLRENSERERVTDWLMSAGAMPTALAVTALVAYLVISLLVGAFGS